MFDIVRFENPRILWLLVVLAPMIAYYVYRTIQGRAAMQVSTVAGVQRLGRTYRYWLRHTPFLLRCLVVALVIFAMVRPQTSEDHQNVNAEGIDIVMALDISGSMLARDFQPDRLSAAKDLPQLKKAGLPLLVVTAMTIVGSFLGSAIIADIVLHLTGAL